MKRLLTFIVMAFTVALWAMGKINDMPKYDIMGAGSGTEGTVLVKVFVYGKKVSDHELKRAAVHGVVFRGFSGNSSGANQPAIVDPSAEEEHEAFFKDFFAEDGHCQNFASIVSGSYDRVKTKKGYKQGAILQVDKRALRKELEKAGVARSLSSGF